MIKNYDKIRELVKGNLTIKEAEQLENELQARTEDEIIEDLKELSIKALKETEQILEDSLDNLYEEQLENNKSIEETTRALERINIALNSKLEDLLFAEKFVKTILDY